jgi:hypothetical protein
MFDRFFGDLSPFQVLVSFGTIIAFLNGAYTLWTVLAKAKLKIFLTDSIGVVIPPRHVAEKFHIGCNLLNPSAKVAALHHLEATVLDPKKQKRRFLWNLFFEYAAGGGQVRKTTDPFPIAVGPRSSAFQFIEFKLAEGDAIDFWPEGRYEFNILGWVNRRDRKFSRNITATFHIEIDQMLSMCLQGTEQSDNVVMRVPIVEWSNFTSRS